MIEGMRSEPTNTLEFVPQAIISRSPAFLSARGIEFRTDHDDLHEFQVAELSLSDPSLREAVPFALMRHAGTPVDETEVYLPDGVPLAHLTSLLSLILRDLELNPEEISWRRESMETAY